MHEARGMMHPRCARRRPATGAIDTESAARDAGRAVPRRARPAGFSLVELLVTISIVAVLVGLLLPAVQSSRDASRGTACGSNVRQLVLALLNYSNARGGRLVPMKLDDQTRIAGTLAGEYPFPGKSRYWFGEVDAGQTDPLRQLDFTAGLLAPFMEGNWAAYQCPAFGAGDVDELAYGRLATGFDYNPMLGRGTPWDDTVWPYRLTSQPMSYSIAQVRETKRTIAFAESAQVRYDLKFLENLGGLVPPSGNFPTVHFRHRGTANVAFLDGHVDRYPWKSAVTVPGDNWLDQPQADRMQFKHLGFVCDGAADDPATRDALYDRD